MKAVFLDRDGVINVERGEYTYLLEDFQIIPGVLDALQHLYSEGYKLIVVTNQSGISQGLYTEEQMKQCHEFLQQKSGGIFEAFYHAPLHPTISKSLSRKPDSLLFERAIFRYSLDPEKCWMVGDKERDLIPARKLKVKTVMFSINQSDFADFTINSVEELPLIILES